MASTGQLSQQAPQLTQVSASMTYCSSPSEMASTGQLSAQAPHLTQASVILYAMIMFLPYVFFIPESVMVNNILARISEKAIPILHSPYIFLVTRGEFSPLEGFAWDLDRMRPN